MDRAVVEQKLKKVTDKIIQEFQPEKIILFGSWAWGRPSLDSDVDLLIVKRTVVPRIERERALRDLLFPQEFAMDLIVHTPEELEEKINQHRNLFLEDIVRNGLVLYAKPNSETVITNKRDLAILFQ